MAYQLRLMSQADDLTIIHWPDVSVNNSQGFVHHFYYCHMSVENAIVSDIIVEEEATKLGIDIRKLKGTSIVESVPDDTWGRRPRIAIQTTRRIQCLIFISSSSGYSTGLRRRKNRK